VCHAKPLTSLRRNRFGPDNARVSLPDADRNPCVSPTSFPDQNDVTFAAGADEQAVAITPISFLAIHVARSDNQFFDYLGPEAALRSTAKRV
jgi:hypothetical protein